MDWGVFPEDDRQQPDWKTADAAIDLLKKLPTDTNFFLAAGFRLPHVPCFASQKWYDMFPPEDQITLPPYRADDRDDIPPFSWYLYWKLPEPRLSWLEANKQWRPLVRSYLATTTFMDSQLGRLLDALQASPHATNTLIVLWSDNAWHLGEKGITGKNTLWDRSTRVPLIFAGPGINPQGRCAEPVELLDIYPSLIELCGLPPQKGLEGHSLLPQLKNPKAKRSWPAVTSHNPGNDTVRTDRWRYIRYADGSEELYDLQRDPNEWENLAAAPVYKKLKVQLAQWLPKNPAPLAPGSAHRTLERKNGKWLWEGEAIVPSELEK
jgi:arylsulfatase A-like enzyme